ncbi:MAG: NUDIX domain-containing protein [Rhodobacteraceae bacterium]|nr:NUDIX domain-containing protein [Paracoccaceae bacterium]
MIKRLHSSVAATFGPLFTRPRRKQVAALCLRRKGQRAEVLMITSRGTGRWILPKGWPIEGLSDANAALQEAWEEAGVKNATLSPRPVGRYRAVKTHPKGVPEPVDTLVFACEVGATSDKWPESHERTRRWMRPEEAAHLVKEPGLKRLLRAASLL